VSIWAVRKDNEPQVLMTNNGMSSLEVKTETLMRLTEITGPPCAAFIDRIDDCHATSQKLWHQMSAPEYLTASQVHELKAISSLTKELHPLAYETSAIKLQTSLRPHSVVLISVELSLDGAGGDEQG
jgi:hypothetical protein